MTWPRILPRPPRPPRPPRLLVLALALVTSVSGLCLVDIDADIADGRAPILGVPAAWAKPLPGEYLKAARMLRTWRYEEARAIINRLAKRAPKSLETRYLRAELAFIDGDYAAVGTLLRGIDDSVAAGAVGRVRALAASSLKVTEEFVSKTSPDGHFVIWYAPGPDEVIVDLTAEVLDTAYRTIGEDFDFYPSTPIRVELLSRPADLARLSPLTVTEIETTGTIALCKYNKLMVVSPRATVFGYPWMDTLVHEYVHHVVSQLSHDSVPVWLHEGLARFEQTRWRKGPDGTLSPGEAQLLGRALAKRRLIEFADMHPSMAKLPSQEAAALAFTEVFSMVTYLHEEVGYRGLRRILALTRGGKSAQRAVAEVMDMPWQRVESSWKSHLRRRKDLKKDVRDAADGRGASAAARSRPKRIHFARGPNHGSGDGDDKRRRPGARGDGASGTDNVGIEEVASDKARDLTRLGGMLRARGMLPAAAIEYEKALRHAPGDPFISAKLSRTYLDLGRARDAIALAEPLAAADENDAGAAVTLGIAYMALDEPDLPKARTALEAALRINPFDPTVRCGLSQLYRDQGQTERAKREHRACERLQP